MLSFESLFSFLMILWLCLWGVKTFLGWIHPGLPRLLSPLRMARSGFYTLSSGYHLLKWSGKGLKGVFRLGFWFFRLPRQWAQQKSLFQLALQDRVPCSVCHQDIPLIPAIRTCPGCRSNLALCHVLEECPHCRHRLTQLNCPHCSVTLSLHRLKKKY